MIKELMERAGGNPFDNRNVITTEPATTTR